MLGACYDGSLVGSVCSIDWQGRPQSTEAFISRGSGRFHALHCYLLPDLVSPQACMQVKMA